MCDCVDVKIRRRVCACAYTCIQRWESGILLLRRCASLSILYNYMYINVILGALVPEVVPLDERT